MDYATIPAELKFGTGTDPDGKMSVLMKIGEMVLMLPIPIAKEAVVNFQKAIERAEARQVAKPFKRSKKGDVS